MFFQDICLAFQTLAYQFCVLVHDIFMTFHQIVSLCDVRTAIPIIAVSRMHFVHS